MPIKIGPSFPIELATAGLFGLPFSWTHDGQFTFGEAMTPEQTAAVNAVFAKHNPSSPTTDQVDAFRDHRLATGYADSVTGKSYECDDTSRGFLTALGASSGLSMGASPQPQFPIVTSDNTVLTLSASDLFALINQRIMPWVSQTVLFARSMKDAISAGNPPADITKGWP